MADDRRELPGSGDVQSDGGGPDPPPAPPQAVTYESPPQPEAAGSARTWWPVCLLVGLGGCGCLVVILLAFGIIGGVSWTLFGGEEATPSNTVSPPSQIEIEEPPGAPESAEPGSPTEQPAPEPGPEPVPEIYRPGEEVAREAALGYFEQPDWVARVDGHSDDWRRVTVSVGPPASEFFYVVSLAWNDGLDVYDLVSIDDVDYPGVE